MLADNKDCQKHHGQHNIANRKQLDPILKEFPENQSGEGRHKCPYCAYEMGYANGASMNDYSENMINTVAPPRQIISVVRWLAKKTEDKTASPIPIGSGVVYSPNGENCLITANHVAVACDYKPQIRQHNSWQSFEWETVGYNEDKDIAVLQCRSADLLTSTHKSPKYGVETFIHGSLGRALGFPLVRDESNLMFSEIEGLPIAIPIPISAYSSSENKEMRSMHYVGGYVNVGFSGGAITFPTLFGWVIAGIITDKAIVLQNESSMPSITTIWEHAGLTKYTDIRIAEFIISVNNLWISASQKAERRN